MIAEFYENCEIFITGGSGVVGKALIEKLLRSCNVRRIFVLLRPKKNMNVEQRLEKLRGAKIFSFLQDIKPNELQKIVAVPGDVELPKLGITPEYAQLMSNVSIVYHCAATVRFDEPIRIALILNVQGTLEALKFAETLKQLKIFLHVSTFYSNPYLNFVEPKLYSSPIDWRTCLKLLENVKDEELLDTLTRKMIIGFPNTYTFTKNLAESLVNDYRHRLPVVIYRPSIVLFALRDPIRGFPPSLMGAMGLFALVGAGILKTIYIGTDIRLDLTPQDLGVKSMMYFTQQAFELYRNGRKPEMVPVYMTSSCTHSTNTFREIAEITDNENLWKAAAFNKSFLLPGCIYTASRCLYMFLVFTKQILPAILADFLMILFGRPPVLMGIVRKGFTTLEVMQPFMFNNYDSPGTTNYKQMIKDTEGTEFNVAKDFTVTVERSSLVALCGNMVFTIRKYLLHEDDKTLERAIKVHNVKLYIYNIIRSILAYFLIRWIYREFLAPMMTGLW